MSGERFKRLLIARRDLLAEDRRKRQNLRR